MHFRRGGGAAWIDGRAGKVGLDPAVQNWDSAIDLTVLRSTFFRNFCNYFGGALAALEVWPLTATFDANDFVHNDALIAQHDIYMGNPPVRLLC